MVQHLPDYLQFRTQDADSPHTTRLTRELTHTRADVIPCEFLFLLQHLLVNLFYDIPTSTTRVPSTPLKVWTPSSWMRTSISLDCSVSHLLKRNMVEFCNAKVHHLLSFKPSQGGCIFLIPAVPNSRLPFIVSNQNTFPIVARGQRSIPRACDQRLICVSVDLFCMKINTKTQLFSYPTRWLLFCFTWHEQLVEKYSSGLSLHFFLFHSKANQR